MTAPIPGQKYEFTTTDGHKAELVVTEVTAAYVEYKFVTWNGSLGRFPYTITRKGWDLRPNGLRLVGMTKVEE